MSRVPSDLNVKRTVLVGGPYRPPAVQSGQWLDDAIDGRVEVGGFSSGPIPWPRRLKSGRASLILCGDLVQAIRTESAVAIAHHFGVGSVTVSKWRVKLGVDRKNNEGTRVLYRSYGRGKPLPTPSEEALRSAELPRIADEDVGRFTPSVAQAKPSVSADAAQSSSSAQQGEDGTMSAVSIYGTPMTSAQRKKGMRQRKAERGDRRCSVDLSTEAREKADRLAKTAGVSRTEWINALILQPRVR